MANEVTVPLLPCPSIDEIVSFYEALGFRRTYRQTRPNPYVVVRREDWEMHFFGMDDFDPADSYGTCVVQVPDVGVVHAAFVAGLRARYGKIPVQGIPRMTRPRRRKNADNLSGSRWSTRAATGSGSSRPAQPRRSPHRESWR